MAHLDEQSRKALLDWKREKRHIKELEEEIVGLCVLISETNIEQQKVWANHQIRSIEHEIAEIKSGRMKWEEDDYVRQLNQDTFGDD